MSRIYPEMYMNRCKLYKTVAIFFSIELLSKTGYFNTQHVQNMIALCLTVKQISVCRD